ncbi:TetR family transcriptional regulator, partial [Rhodococcus hoagii]|nr:TetR family transcriptional regulator [Prescottella equi]
MTVETPEPHARAAPPTTAKRVQAAAAELFAEQGFAATGVRDIAGT